MGTSGSDKGWIGAHSHQKDWWDPEKARETFERAQLTRRERHQAILAERKAKREAPKAIARQEGGFIGPPSPFMHRKGRPPMKVTR
jgi:hypothetical protein